MAHPIPGCQIGTPYGKRGSHWSCKRDSKGRGIHTGVDFPAKLGTKIYAPIAGQIRHRNYGSAFGKHQFAISPDSDQPFGKGEVFFAHTRTRLKDGTRVKVGDYIAEVGNEGNSTGPHLHMEYMPNSKKRWACGLHADPKPILDHAAGDDVPGFKQGGKVYSSKMWYGQKDSDSVENVQIALNKAGANPKLPETGNYLDQTLAAAKKFQEKQGWSGKDADGIVGPGTARKLGLTWVDDGPPPKSKTDSKESKEAKVVRKAVKRVTAKVDFRPRFDDPSIAGKHGWPDEDKGCILHHTVGTNSLSWLESGGDHKPVPGAHFLIAENGTLHVLTCREAYHAGSGGPLFDWKKNSANPHTWGIEVESLGEKPDFTEEQLLTIQQLLVGLIKYGRLNRKWVIGHKTWNPKGKPNDPRYDDKYWQTLIDKELSLEEK